MFGIAVGDILQVVCVLLMVAGTLCVIFTPRLIERDGMRRAIQFLTVVLVVPTILILALRNILQAETVGTLLGGLIGYLLSGIGMETPRSKSDSKSGSKGTQPNETKDVAP